MMVENLLKLFAQTRMVRRLAWNIIEREKFRQYQNQCIWIVSLLSHLYKVRQRRRRMNSENFNLPKIRYWFTFWTASRHGTNNDRVLEYLKPWLTAQLTIRIANKGAERSLELMKMI